MWNREWDADYPAGYITFSVPQLCGQAHRLPLPTTATPLTSRQALKWSGGGGGGWIMGLREAVWRVYVCAARLWGGGCFSLTLYFLQPLTKRCLFCFFFLNTQLLNHLDQFKGVIQLILTHAIKWTQNTRHWMSLQITVSNTGLSSVLFHQKNAQPAPFKPDLLMLCAECTCTPAGSAFCLSRSVRKNVIRGTSVRQVQLISLMQMPHSLCALTHSHLHYYLALRTYRQPPLLL